MNREEKNQQTRQKIIDSALQEFSKKGYGASSVNTICSDGGVSKGIVYHYFDTKDDIYLTCVEMCFRTLTDYIKDNLSLEGKNTTEQLEAYFNIRLSFFCAWPIYQRLFCNAVMMPPLHLKEAIRARRAEFDELNITILNHMISPLKLRPGISKDEVIETFRQYQDYINAKFQVNDAENIDINMRERSCQRALDILLYGVVDQSNGGI